MNIYRAAIVEILPRKASKHTPMAYDVKAFHGPVGWKTYKNARATSVRRLLSLISAIKKGEYAGKYRAVADKYPAINGGFPTIGIERVTDYDEYIELVGKEIARLSELPKFLDTKGDNRVTIDGWERTISKISLREYPNETEIRLYDEYGMEIEFSLVFSKETMRAFREFVK